MDGSHQRPLGLPSTRMRMAPRWKTTATLMNQIKFCGSGRAGVVVREDMDFL
jgi:hypothetical protein